MDGERRPAHEILLEEIEDKCETLLKVGTRERSSPDLLKDLTDFCFFEKFSDIFDEMVIPEDHLGEVIAKLKELLTKMTERGSFPYSKDIISILQGLIDHL